MKVTTSVQLSEDLLAAVDERARRHNKDRSSIIEAAVRTFIAPLTPELSKADLQILDQQADRLNLEAEDVLAYQFLS